MVDEHEPSGNPERLLKAADQTGAQKVEPKPILARMLMLGTFSSNRCWSEGGQTDKPAESLCGG